VRNAEAVADQEGLGATAIGVQCDVSDEDNMAGGMRATLGRLGRLDCLVANAGTAGKQSFTDMTLGEWHRVLHVNLDGAFLCLREAGPRAGRAGAGRVTGRRVVDQRDPRGSRPAALRRQQDRGARGDARPGR
jgi:NAD(P)-dependent dehydrogenase (short-subunit alcohol dehydrogenase family)